MTDYYNGSDATLQQLFPRRTTAASTHALQISEILFDVLSQLDQHTLLWSTRLVSRLWNSHSHALIAREVVWTEGSERQQKISTSAWISRLSQASAVRCEQKITFNHFSKHITNTRITTIVSVAEKQDGPWRDLGALIVSSQQQQQDQPRHHRQPGPGRHRFPRQTLRQLTFHEIDQTMIRLGDLIPYLPQSTLTTLRLRVSKPTTVRLDYILDRLPNLEDVTISCSFPISCKFALLAIIPMVHPTATGQGIGEGSRTRLKSLVLQELLIASEVVEDLLMRSPDLVSLELSSIHPIPKPNLNSRHIVNPPMMTASYQEHFNIVLHSAHHIAKEQVTDYFEEMIQVMKRCHAAGLGKTLERLAFEVSRGYVDEAAAKVTELVELYGWRGGGGSGSTSDDGCNVLGGQVRHWGLSPSQFSPSLCALSKRAARMQLSAFEYPFETEDQEEVRVRRHGPMAKPPGGKPLPPRLRQSDPAAIFSSLRVIPNTLTILQLNYAFTDRLKFDGELLHCYLCHSPNLRHLLAPALTIGLDNFDIFERYFLPVVTARDRLNGTTEDTINLSRSSKEFYLQEEVLNNSAKPLRHRGEEGREEGSSMLRKKRVWACRGLETLQIQIIVRGGVTGASGAKNRIDPQSPVLYRILFGYIAIVVPKLRVLEVGVSALHLDAGMALLTRLRHLERLVVESNRNEPAQYCMNELLTWLQRYQWPSFLTASTTDQPNSSSHQLPAFLLPELPQKQLRREPRQDPVAVLGPGGEVFSVDKDVILNRQEKLRVFLDTLPPSSTFEEQLLELGQISEVKRVIAEMELDDLSNLLDRCRPDYFEDDIDPDISSSSSDESSDILDHMLDYRRWPRLQWVDLIASRDYTTTKLAKEFREWTSCPNKIKDPLERLPRRHWIDIDHQFFYSLPCD